MSVSTTAGITACELMSIQGTPESNYKLSEPIGKISSTGPSAPKPPALACLHSAVDPASNARSASGQASSFEVEDAHVKHLASHKKC